MEDIKNKFVEEESTVEIEKAISDDQNAIPYSPMSKLPNMGTVIPLNLAGETLQAQFKVLEEIPDTDAYLVEKLGYSSKYALSQAVSAEQADAVTLAIRQIEKDKGFILADMAGIGKGRVGASMIRYAITNGYTPIFITEKPNLFSAMYRDITDIGGLRMSGGKISYGMPLILNGFKSGGFEKTYDENGKLIKIPKPSETGITNAKGEEIITAPSQEKIKDILKKDVLPAPYDMVMLTYSQLAGTAGKVKVDYLTRMIKNAKDNGSGVILIMDEAHNAAGTKSDVGKSMSDIISLVKGVTFVSATFSKRPDNMNIYALKTDIADSPLGTKKLLEVIKEGGERLTENLASNLVSSQQMIRRERTFENCNVEYNYMSDDEKTELFQKYDDSVKLFRRLVDFYETPNFIEAKNNAIKKFATEKGVELCTEPKPNNAPDQKAWVKRNEGKYFKSVFTAGEIKRNQFQFIETLLFALKADFVANQALAQMLDNQLENISIDKSRFKSSRKPVIAVRNTLEGVYSSLGLQVGDEINKADFSMYVYALALDGLNGTITLKEITESDKKKTVEGDISIQDDDFPDKGQAYRDIVAEIEAIDLNIPLSPIDYIINKIEATPRPSWNTYGDNFPTFRVGEVTGRKFTLVKQPNGKYKLETNQKPKNKGTTFKMFNSGVFDVLLINESGSTGEDAHSSAKFADQRPRVMIIHQVELDVNTEVQKRGRINRTGMVNYPTYIYAVSRIPSEVRRLLMLVRKLRSLDANTTANQKQSAKLSAIRDSFGNEIEDVINKYGDECLNEFVGIPENESYLRYMPRDAQGKLAELSNSFIIEVFVRNLELSLSDEQEYFYNTINALYISLKTQLEEAGAYDLETNIVDLKASIKTRVLVSKGLNTNPFNTSVYEEDDYVLAEDKPYTLERVNDLILELAKGQDPDQFYENFIEDFKKYFQDVQLKELVDNIKVPDYLSARDEMEKMQMEAEYNAKVQNTIARAKDEHQAVLNIIDAKNDNGNPILRPNRPALIPAILEECSMTDEDGLPIRITELNNAKFAGVRILNTAKDKYSPMNIELMFCQLSGKPRLILKPTAKGREVLDWVVTKTASIEIPRIVKINNWEVDENKRTIKRLITGNILGAYGVAKDYIARNPDKYSPVLNFLKFTTADGTSLRLGIGMNLRRFSALNPSSVPVQYPLKSPDLISALSNSEKWIRSTNGSETFMMQYHDGGLDIYVYGGTDRETKSKEKRFLSKLYDNGEFVDLLNKHGIRNYRTLVWYQPVGSSKRSKVKAICISGYLPNKMEAFQEIFNFIYSIDPFNIALTGVDSEETIFNKEDLFNPELSQSESEREGEFTYNTLVPYNNVKESVSGFSKFEKYEKTSPFGTVYLKKRAGIKEVLSYGLVPLDNTLIDMVSDTFQVLTSDTDKIKLKEDISKAVSSGMNNYQIGSIVNKALYGKVQRVEQIFGPEGEDTDFLGQVFKSYAKGEVELPESKKREQGEEREEHKMPERPLDIETAQEYLILLTYKIKN